MPTPKRESFEVVLDAPELGPSGRVGILRRHDQRTDVPASFEYDETWLKSKRAFMLDPRLGLWGGEQHPPGKASAFGVFMDSAPDRWGSMLMERREAARALREGRPMRRLQEMDFLLGVADAARAGALRFRSPSGGPFLAHGENPAPPVTSLPELAYISQRLDEAGASELPEYEKWLAMLIAPGTSLGGARPKASFTDEKGNLGIAKFPAHEDRYDVGGWEFVTHQLARDAGIWVPDARLLELTERGSTFCVSRFDRSGADRRMFVSAMTLLERADGEEGASYLDLAASIADQGASKHVEQDLEQLFRRVAFNVLVGNRDDHPRNHGFIRERTGWRLSPAYDMNPNPNRAEHQLTIDGKVATPSIELVAQTAGYYRLDSAKAKRIITKVKTVVATWPQRAKEQGLSRAEIARMKGVFQV